MMTFFMKYLRYQCMEAEPANKYYALKISVPDKCYIKEAAAGICVQRVHFIPWNGEP